MQTDKLNKHYPNQFRLDIGTDDMNPFAGLSDGDLFRANGEIYRLSMHTQYGLTLRKHDDVTKTLPGFVNLPDYHTFVHNVNLAAVNGLNSLNQR